MTTQTTSTSPSGEEFTLPTEADYKTENDRLSALVAEHKELGHEIVVVLGASYREDVGDTRYSGSELIVRKLTEMGAEVQVHDPYVKHWWELEKQDTYPAPGHPCPAFSFFAAGYEVKGLGRRHMKRLKEETAGK